MRTFSDSGVLIGDPAFGSDSSNTASVVAQFEYDTVDYIAVPRAGTSFSVGWLGARRDLGSDIGLDIVEAFLLKPQTWGRHTLTHWWNAGWLVDDRDNEVNAFRLGGLFNVSGYAPDEIIGKDGGIGRLLYYYRLGTADLPAFETQIYLGASLEAAYVREDRGARLRDSLLMAGSVFAVVDTVVGPIYLAYGAAERGRRSAYLFLGQTF
jgi:NTE family protein